MIPESGVSRALYFRIISWELCRYSAGEDRVSGRVGGGVGRDVVQRGFAEAANGLVGHDFHPGWGLRRGEVEEGVVGMFSSDGF